MRLQRIGAPVPVLALLQGPIRRRMSEFVSGFSNKTGGSVRFDPIEDETEQ
jgi:hypothetical protein